MSFSKPSTSILNFISAFRHANSNRKFIVQLNQKNSMFSSSSQLTNRYPPIGNTSQNPGHLGEQQHQKKISPLRKLFLLSAFAGSLALGVMVLYGREDPRFRKKMVNDYPPTRYVFDLFLGPFGMTPYLIPAYEFKEEVKEKVSNATENIKDKVSSHLVMANYIKNKLQPPLVEEEQNLVTDRSANGMLPNEDFTFFVGDKKKEDSQKKRNGENKVQENSFENDEYSKKLLKALYNAQNQVADIVNLKKHLIQDYHNHNLFSINMTSLASRNEETDARKAITHLIKVISEGKSCKKTSRNAYITPAVKTAIHFTKQLDQLDYLEQVAKHETGLNSDAESKLIWE